MCSFRNLKPKKKNFKFEVIPQKKISPDGEDLSNKICSIFGVNETVGINKTGCYQKRAEASIISPDAGVHLHFLAPMAPIFFPPATDAWFVHFFFPPSIFIVWNHFLQWCHCNQAGHGICCVTATHAAHGAHGDMPWKMNGWNLKSWSFGYR